MLYRLQAWTLCVSGLATLVGLSLATPWITEIPDGLEVDLDSQALVVRGEWTVLITLDEPQPPVGVTDHINSLLALAGKTRLSMWTPGWKSRLNTVQRQCTSPRRWWLHQKTRTKRGLLNIVGKASKFLFGTATDDDLRDVHRLVNQLQERQNRLVTVVSEFTTVVNHTYDEIQANRDQLNRIIWHLSALAHAINQRFETLTIELQVQRQRADFEMLVQEIERIGDRYEQSHLAWLHRKENLETGRLTENLLPPEILRNILTSAATQELELVMPIQWYYEYTPVMPIWSTDQLVYRVRLPVVGTDTWHFVHIQHWPVPVGNWQTILDLPTDLLRNTETGELNISPDCYGTRPRVCRLGLITRAAQQPCLAHLLNAKPSYDDSCPLMLARRPPVDNVYPQRANEYILTTPGTTMTLRCAGRAEETLTVDTGVFRLRLRHPCSLHGPNWALQSIFQRTVNVTITPKPIQMGMNLSLASLLTDRLRLDPLAFNLSTLGPVDRTQISVGDLLTLPDMASAIQPSPLLSLSSLILVPLVAAAVFLGRRLLGRRQAPPRGTEIELEPMRAGAPEITPAAEPPRVFRSLLKLATVESDPRN